MKKTTDAPVSKGTDTLVEADVIELYRAFLDRMPESDAAIRQAMGHGTKARLRSVIVSSPEFRQRAPECIKQNIMPLDTAPNSVKSTRDAAKLKRLYDNIQRHWTKLGEEKAHWSVLSSPQYKSDSGGKIDAEREAAFYHTGKAERAMLDRILERAGRSADQMPQAFEFGCGLGRMTLQLAQMFDHVTGCDISANHLAGAREAAKARGHDNIDFVHGTVDGFGMTEGFDFWYSRIVLQHNPPPIIEAVLTRALDLLRPGGLAVFQVPTQATRYGFDIDAYLARPEDEAGRIEMHCLPQQVIFGLVRDAGCHLVELREDGSVGIARHWVSNTFVIEKPATSNKGAA